MKRGLKRVQGAAVAPARRAGQKMCPDEEGIETVAALEPDALPLTRQKMCPDEEGIETRGLILETWLLLPFGQKMCPDEEGIETSCPRRLLGGLYRSQKMCPDEEGIETDQLGEWLLNA